MWFKLFVFFSVTIIVTAKPRANTCGYEACPAASPDALNVHIVPHSHDDVGWIKSAEEYHLQDVQTLLSSVVSALKQNPDRRFIQVETYFFKKWWDQQSPSKKEDVLRLINNGQLEIINGGWSMNDEGCVHYQFTIDQYTLGIRFLEDVLGECSRSTVGWQIDPFGHSREQASINAQMGFDSMFFARLDYRDKQSRVDNKNLDLLWRGSSNLGNSSDLFTSVLYQHYSAPAGFCFDISCNDDPIIDDEESPDYNFPKRVEDFANFVREQASHFATNNIIVVMGDDFRYQAAFEDYINTDRLMDGLNNKFPQTFEDKPIRAFYSTPSCYTKAVNDYVWEHNVTLQIKTDDFMPYADGVGGYIVGYYTSRSTSKRFIRESNTILQIGKQLGANEGDSYDNANVLELKEALGIAQHHDAITGTEYQEVAEDYHRLLHSGVTKTTQTISGYLSNLIGASDDLDFKSCLLANMSSCEQSQGDEFTVAIYNPLSRTVSSVVSLPVNNEDWDIADPEGNSVVFQISEPAFDFSYVDDVPISKYMLDFNAANIPPLGYNVYRFRKTSKNGRSVETKPRLDPGYEDTKFVVDDTTGLLTSVTMNNISLDISQDFFYYKNGGSQCWMFKPADNTPTRIAQGTVSTSAISGDIYQGVRQDFGNMAKQVIKVYNDDRSFIEFDWVVGPINIDDGGKEIITRFSTYMKSDKTFYTDSNGREILKRVRNFRPDFEYTDEQPVAGNYYPVTSRIIIKDEINDVELAVLTDRSEGGSSVSDGEVELMLHRALSTDVFGLNEQQYGKPIMVRGKSWLVLGKTEGNGEKSMAAIRRDIALRKFLPPWTFISNKAVADVDLKNLKGSLITKDLPENVQILSLEPWKDGVLLLRLEHLLEAGEDENLSKEVTVDLSGLFSTIKISGIQETILTGNINIEDKVRLGWPGSDSGRFKKFDVKPLEGLEVTLKPMQIRTFLVMIN